MLSGLGSTAPLLPVICLPHIPTPRISNAAAVRLCVLSLLQVPHAEIQDLPVVSMQDV